MIANVNELGKSSQQTQSGTSLAESSASTGNALSSASTAVEDGKMAAMKPVASTTTIAPNTPQKRSNPSGIPNSQTASAYDTDLIQSMVGMQYGAA